MFWAESSTICARRQGTPAHDPHQPFSLVIVDLTNPDTLGHRPSFTDQTPDTKPPARTNLTGRT
jgi:hypothetical protein